jgi:hypothetical protein
LKRVSSFYSLCERGKKKKAWTIKWNVNQNHAEKRKRVRYNRKDTQQKGARNARREQEEKKTQEEIL